MCTTCATTYLNAAGADLKDIQHTLGHSSVAITADTYTSVLTELQRHRPRRRARRWFGPPDPPTPG
jgi:site-specific recombinase XerD